LRLNSLCQNIEFDPRFQILRLSFVFFIVFVIRILKPIKYVCVFPRAKADDVMLDIMTEKTTPAPETDIQ